MKINKKIVAAAVVLGACAALASLLIVYHPNNLMMAINPLDQMMRFAIWADSRLGEGGHFVSARLIEKLAEDHSRVRVSDRVIGNLPRTVRENE